MNESTIAGRYARALFETAKENNSLQLVADDIERLRKIITEVKGVKNFCFVSHKNHTAVMEFVDTAFIPYIGNFTGKLLKEAVKNGRLSSIPYIPDAFKMVLDKESGNVSVVLETVRTAEPEFLSKIEEKMKIRTGKEIIITNTVVPEIISGFRLLWQNRILDLSASGRIRKLRKELKR